jgi:hypothetical protein
MPSFIWSLREVQVQNQKADSDNDYLSLNWSILNNDTKNVSSSSSTQRIGGVIHTGDTIQGPFETPPIEVGPNDVLSLNVLITNLGSSDEEEQFAQAVKITEKVGGTLASAVAGVVGLITGGPTGAGVAIEAVRKVTSAVDDTLKALFDIFHQGPPPPNCNGEVAHLTLLFTLDQLQAAVNQEASQVIAGPQTESRCGEAPHTKLVFAVRAPVAPHSGNFIQSRFGRQGNFELLVPIGGRLVHFFRDNDAQGLPWHRGAELPNSANVTGAALIESNFGTPGNLEVVARQGDALNSFFFDGAARQWNGPIPLLADGQPVTGVTGNRALIQSRFGTQGNFELLVPIGGRLVHFFRDNDAQDLPWHRGAELPNSANAVGAALIESNFGTPGNLEVVARQGDALNSFFFGGAARQWNGPIPLLADGQPVTGVTGF